MFFADRIKSIKPGDRVLDVGPGGDPHPRSNVLLEIDVSEEELAAQRGYRPDLKTDKETVYYDGKIFPFKDNEFDYVICAHVLEHVDDIQLFLKELNRVAKNGYLEFPTVYYDHLYNFDVHPNLLRYDEASNTIFYKKKTDTPYPTLKPVNALFYRSLELGYVDIINDLKPFMIQGFEWKDKTPRPSRAKSIYDLTLDISSMKPKTVEVAEKTPEPAPRPETPNLQARIKRKIRKFRI